MTNWLLRDEFTTDRAAGAVNGTGAEPGPGTRTVVDANNQLSLASGAAVFGTGWVTFGNPGLWYGQLARVPGLLLVSDVVLPAGAAVDYQVGFDTNQISTINANALYVSAAGVRTQELSVSQIVSSFTYSATHKMAVVLRTAGAFHFLKLATDTAWRLMFVHHSANAAVYPGVTGVSPIITSTSFIRIPDELWLPTPLISDGFGSAFGVSDGLGHAEGIAGGIGSGGSGVAWTGSTWSVSGGKAINTPTVGANSITNGGFADSSGWTLGADWSIGSGVATHAVAAGTNISQTGVLTGQRWYKAQADITAVSGGSGLQFLFGTAGNPTLYTTTGTKVATWLANGTGARDAAIRAGTSTALTIDNVAFNILTLSELISSVVSSTPDVISGINLTVATGYQCGLCLNLDSTSTPANFVLAYHNGVSAILEKCVTGTYTTLVSVAATYVAGARLVVAKNGTKYRLYYNNALVGTEQTISDAGIINNTRHGMFSTNASNTLDDFVVYATGTGGEYANLDNYGFDVEGVATVVDGVDTISSGGIVAGKCSDRLPYYSRRGRMRC